MSACLGLGDDAEQPGQRASGAGRSRVRDGAAGRGGDRVPGGVEGVNPLACTALLGHGEGKLGKDGESVGIDDWLFDA